MVNYFDMKLELKDLAPYLPYGLKFYAGKIGNCHLIYPMLGIIDENTILSFTNGEDDANGYNKMVLKQMNLKPILRPLSDLTEQQYAELDLNHNFSIVRFSDLEKDPTRYPYTIVQKLIEWHFDVFGFIEKGLAIDINTLKQ